MIGIDTGGLENKRMSGDHPNFSIVEKNNNKNPGDLSRLAVTQIPGENHQLTLMGKSFKE